MTLPTQSATPWGHKLTVHVYVAGDVQRALDVSDAICGARLDPEPEFVGVSVSEVAEEPKGMGDA